MSTSWKYLMVIPGLSLLLALLGCATVRSPSVQQMNQDLRGEILAMHAADQQARQNFSAQMPPEDVEKIKSVDKRNTVRMREILKVYGWPGRTLVGEDGAHGAWILIQHSDLKLMKQALPLMKKAVQNGEALAQDYAFLHDRVLINEGKPQIYGTQYAITPEGSLRQYPVESPEALNERRREIGLEPIEEYETWLRKRYQIPAVPAQP